VAIAAIAAFVHYVSAEVLIGVFCVIFQLVHGIFVALELGFCAHMGAQVVSIRRACRDLVSSDALK